MRVHTVKKARKTHRGTGVKKGDTYYWWKFRYGPVIRSKTYPKRSQLTRSSFLSTLYSLQDDFIVDPDNLEGDRDDRVSEIEQLRDECQDSLDNMPEQLQENSESGQTLTERIEALNSWAEELEGIDCEIDSDDENESEADQRERITAEIQDCDCDL